MFRFKSKDRKITTPLGDASVRDGIVSAPPWRYRGTLIEVRWKEERAAPIDQVSAIRAEFDRYVDLGLAELGVSEFPTELRTIVPECIDFLSDDADWTLGFRCAEWPDAWWTVDFKDGKIVGHNHGD